MLETTRRIAAGCLILVGLASTALIVEELHELLVAR
jgi:hypothetical protein